MSVINAVRDDILAMKAYQVAQVPEGFIKLDAMESPYAYPEEMKAELGKILADIPVNLYPHVASSRLPEMLRQTYGIADEAQLVLGNGSDELIQLMTMLFAKEGATMLAPEPTFVMYRHNAALFGMNYVGVPLHDDFSLDVAAMLAAIEAHQPALIFIAYPNNPTGRRFAREEVEAIIAAATGVVVIDEAYGAFSSDSFVNEAGKNEQLIVLRTMSKVGSAGLRIGYAAGHPKLMNELAKIVPPYNMNRLSLAAAEFALNYRQFMLENIAKLKAERERMRTAFHAYDCIKDFPSEANFLTLRVPDANALYQALYEAKILIKNLHGVHPLLDECVRITIGLPEENQAVLTVVESLYGQGK